MEVLPLSNLIEYQKEFITIEENQEYTRVTARLHRKGLVLRDTVKGFEIKTKRQQVCRTDQLLVAEIDAKVGGYGIVPKELEGAVVSSHYFLFNIDTGKLLPRYLAHVLRTDGFFSQIKAQGSTNYAAIRPNDVLSIEIPYCDVDLQKNIAERLDSLTQKSADLSRNTLREKDFISKLRLAILQEALSGRLVPQDPNDEPASELLKRIEAETESSGEKQNKRRNELSAILEEEIPYDLPQGWAWVRLGQIIHVSSGDGLTSDMMNSEGRIPVFGSNGVIGHYDKSNIDKPSVLVGRVGSCGSVNLTPEKAWVTDNALVTRFNQECIDTNFLVWLLRGTNLKANEKATAQPVISGRKIYPIVVGLPPLPEQKRIVEKVEGLTNLCGDMEEVLKENQKQSESLEEAVLKEAFTS